MFKKLRSFGYRRTAEEAFGFYVVYTLGLIACLMIIGPFLKITGSLGSAPEDIRMRGAIYGMMLNMIYCGGMSAVILRKKKISSVQGWAVGVLSVVAAVPHGIFGMAIVAYLTTRPKRWPVSKKEAARRSAVKADRKILAADSGLPPPPVGPAPPRVQPVVSVSRPRPERIRPSLDGASDQSPPED